MPQLEFNRLLDRWKHRILSYAGTRELLDHLNRSDVNFKDFKLTSTQMDTLNATPVELLAAPGAGLVNVIEGIVTRVVPGGTAFELGSGVLSFLDTDGSGAKLATDVPNATVESATETYYRSVGLAVVPVVNSKVVAKTSADVTAGNGTIYGRIYYRTLKVSELLL